MTFNLSSSHKQKLEFSFAASHHPAWPQLRYTFGLNASHWSTGQHVGHNRENMCIYTYDFSAVTPTTTKALLDAGYVVNVERSPERIFDDAEFEKVGATLVPEGSWMEAPHDHIIIGLKELPEDDCESLKSYPYEPAVKFRPHMRSCNEYARPADCTQLP